MAKVLIAETYKLSVDEANIIEESIPEGGDMEMQLHLKESTPGWVVSSIATSIDLALKLKSVPLRDEIRHSAGVISIKWRKGFPFLPVIIAALLVIGLIVVFFLALQIFREVTSNPILFIPLILVGVGVVMFASKKGKKAIAGR